MPHIPEHKVATRTTERAPEEILGLFKPTKEQRENKVLGAVRIRGFPTVFTLGEGGRLIKKPTELLTEGFREEEVLPVTPAEARMLGITLPGQPIVPVAQRRFQEITPEVERKAVEEAKTLEELETALETEQEEVEKEIITVPVREAAKVTEEIEEVTAPEIERPELPQLRETFESLREEFGVDELEADLATAESDIELAEANLRKSIADIRGKPVSISVIQGREARLRGEVQEQINDLIRSRNSTARILNSKYNTINSLVQLTQQDYQFTVQAYQNEFSRNMQLFNAAQGIMESEKTAEQRERDSARSDLQIFYNAIADRQVIYDDLTNEMKTHITGLETKIGWPTGFASKIIAEGAGRKMLTSTTFENAQNQRVVSVIFQEADGTLVPENFIVGTVAPSGAERESQKERDRVTFGWIFTDAQKLFADIRKSDKEVRESQGEKKAVGYIPWDIYQSYLAELPFDLQEDFNDQFSKFLSPSDRDAFLGREETTL